ncbi:hypothetical protein L3Q67_25760 [Saccharothrix sp. AJ9571]|nr:hypothetical protein L3Q67_25760 [Saccharothrix sp. AJ9571]
MSDLQPAQPPYTTASLARLVVADAARELAERAAGLVPISGNELSEDGKTAYPGELLSTAAGVLAQARELFTAAAIAERMGGASWQQLGDVLGITRQSAQDRFGTAEQEFRGHLALPQNPDYIGEFEQVRLDRAAREPDVTAAELDLWVHHHHQDHAGEPDPHPVSGGLARMNPHAELAQLSELSHQLWKATERLPPLQQRLAIAERTWQLWQQIAADSPRSRTARDAAEQARRTVTELRAQLPDADAVDLTTHRAERGDGPSA